ncbi:hypothetical protein MIMGU_mgv1a016814mg [Erythranthe guttata]|uniref:Stomagen C-terminal domain-containing protein n=1 Tax=Erythranthe guttata TaxID=4155 RepID=A0A022RGN7_ERYGU|nr:PREDICTED: EPIDERMAL PATTERNING FACTOR-like protein 9 [Erythranthe guttata]EYU39169.1 hypothetical protein MIMGU_mgv1a016814mg [Erythranthe guttata]|eukprot:XP_012835209.1 PREDICTED: EPIDERMAL PATTERNING FACTOR-like protein 9 [Erythranthe guttata]
MANVKHLKFQFLLLAFFFAAALVQEARGSRIHATLHNYPTGYRLSSAETETHLKDKSKRLLIGSVAPTCTYNECRGCKYKCRAEQVPVEGNDPINSAYHYKCVCHR